MNTLLESLDSLRKMLVLSRFEDDLEPEEEDVFIQDTRGGGTEANQGGKTIATLDDDWDKFYKDILGWMNKSKFWPTVWVVSDHGNTEVDTDFITYSRKHGGMRAAGVEGIYSKVGPTGDLESPSYREVDHEFMRIETMSIPALRTRITKIGKPEKMYAFIYALEKQVDIYGANSPQGQDYKELADSARNYLKIWGYDTRGRVMSEKLTNAGEDPTATHKEELYTLAGLMTGAVMPGDLRQDILSVIKEKVWPEIDEKARMINKSNPKDLARIAGDAFEETMGGRTSASGELGNALRSIQDAVDEVWHALAREWGKK